jgi:hypothetical protein
VNNANLSELKNACDDAVKRVRHLYGQAPAVTRLETDCPYDFASTYQGRNCSNRSICTRTCG